MACKGVLNSTCNNVCLGVCVPLHLAIRRRQALSSSICLLYGGRVSQATTGALGVAQSNSPPTVGETPSYEAHCFVHALRQQPRHLVDAIRASRLLLAHAGKAKAQKLGLALEELYADLGQPADRKLLCSLLGAPLTMRTKPPPSDSETIAKPPPSDSETAWSSHWISFGDYNCPPCDRRVTASAIITALRVTVV